MSRLCFTTKGKGSCADWLSEDCKSVCLESFWTELVDSSLGVKLAKDWDTAGGKGGLENGGEVSQRAGAGRVTDVPVRNCELFCNN